MTWDWINLVLNPFGAERIAVMTFLSVLFLEWYLMALIFGYDPFDVKKDIDGLVQRGAV